jgi:hypothetical protein
MTTACLTSLTLNLGLRYDIYTPMVEEYNRLANFDFRTGLFVAPGVTPGTTRSGDVATNWKNFSPRIGFAYSLGNDHKTAVRGGYGIFYDMQADQNDTELAYNDQPGVYGSQSFTAPLGPTPVMILSQGPPPIIFSKITDPTGRASAAYFHNPTTYIEEWNLNIERQLAKDMVLQVGYEGHAGRASDLLEKPESGYDTDLGKLFRPNRKRRTTLRLHRSQHRCHPHRGPRHQSEQ